MATADGPVKPINGDGPLPLIPAIEANKSMKHP